MPKRASSSRDEDSCVSIQQASEWVAKALMDAGDREPAKGGGTISIAKLAKTLEKLSKQPEAVEQAWQPYAHYEWHEDKSHPAHGTTKIANFDKASGKGNCVYGSKPDKSWSQGAEGRPYSFFSQRMGAGAFGGYGRKEMPHVHIPYPQPRPGAKPHTEPAVLQVKDGVPVQYGDFLGVGVRMVHPANPRAPATNLGYSLLYVAPHVVQEPGSHETEEAYVIVKGNGHMWLNGRRTPVGPGTWIWLPPWTEHGIENTGNETLEIMVLTSPPNP